MSARKPGVGVGVWGVCLLKAVAGGGRVTKDSSLEIIVCENLIEIRSKTMNINVRVEIKIDFKKN